MSIKVKIKPEGTAKIYIDKQELNLDKTLDCGQAFRWKKDKNNNWSGVVGNCLWVLHQHSDYIDTNITKDELQRAVSYFNLDMNYNNTVNRLQLDEFAAKVYKIGKGIHILRQDLFETTVTFLMSQLNNMNNIRNIVNKLCETYGEKITATYNGVEYTDYTFPTLEVLATLQKEDFEALSMGFRARHMFNLCQKLNKDKNFLEQIKEYEYKKALSQLKLLSGIGNKVANCICLFSLHHIQAFPIDIHIERLIEREYNGDIDINNYGNIAGVIQQYMYYYEAFENKKNKKTRRYTKQYEKSV